MKYRTLIDNPWSKKGEITEWFSFTGEVYIPGHGKMIVVISPETQPGIWEPIEEEEIKKLDIETLLISDGQEAIHMQKTNELIDAANSLTERVKRLEEK